MLSDHHCSSCPKTRSSQNQARIAMIEVEQTTEPFASPDGATAVIRGCHERRADESIADALVVAFRIVVPDILGDDESEMPLAKRDDVAQALSPNGVDEALGEGVEIRAQTAAVKMSICRVNASMLTFRGRRSSTTQFDLLRSSRPAKERFQPAHDPCQLSDNNAPSE